MTVHYPYPLPQTDRTDKTGQSNERDSTAKQTRQDSQDRTAKRTRQDSQTDRTAKQTRQDRHCFYCVCFTLKELLSLSTGVKVQ